MKNLKIVMAVCLSFAVGMSGCEAKTMKNASVERNVSAKVVKKAHPDGVELIVFHGKQRCLTCRAIEKYALEEMNASFINQIRAGKVVVRVVDFSTKEGEKEADEYKVASSSLFVNKWKNGEKTSENLTQFAFANARRNTAKYREGLRSKIKELLK